MPSLLIRNGRVIDPSQNLDQIANVRIEEGLVVSIGPQDAPADEVIEADGLLVTPGLIDMHVQVREPGHEEDETIQSAVAAALAGGFTSIAVISETQPPVDTAAAVSTGGCVSEITAIEVNPPASAAATADWIVSSSSWPGSRTWTCMSISPGVTNRPSASMTSSAGASWGPIDTTSPSSIRTLAIWSRFCEGSMTRPLRIKRLGMSAPLWLGCHDEIDSGSQ